MLRAVKCTGVITFHSSQLLDSPATLGGLPCFCCMFHFTLITLVHISYFVQKSRHRHPHCTTDFPTALWPSSHLVSSSLALLIVPDLFFKDPCLACQPFFSLGRKVEVKLGLDVILINGTFKPASRLFFVFSPSTVDKRALINHVQIKTELSLLIYFSKRYINL